MNTEQILYGSNGLVAAVSVLAASKRWYVLIPAALACCGLGIYGCFYVQQPQTFILVGAGLLTLAAGAVLRRRALAAERKMRKDLIALRKDASGLMGQLAELSAEMAANEAKAAEAKKLFEVTRDLGEEVRVSGMRKEFGRCLRSAFSLKAAHLVFLDREDTDQVYRTYDLLTGEREKDRDKPIRLLRSHGLAPHYFAAKPGDGFEVAAVPLRFRNRVEAVVVLDGARSRGRRLRTDELASILAPLADQFNMAYNRCMLYDEVERKSRTDGLTQVWKKGFLLERAREELDRVEEKGLQTTFVMFDIDHFKDYNDTYGHLVGDVVLRHVAGFLRANVRTQDVVGRYGGEEFLVVLVETPKEGGKVVAERTRRAVEEFRFPVEDKETGITISAGLATSPGDGTELRAVITEADKAMYRAKQTGRNRVCATGE